MSRANEINSWVKLLLHGCFESGHVIAMHQQTAAVTEVITKVFNNSNIAASNASYYSLLEPEVAAKVILKALADHWAVVHVTIQILVLIPADICNLLTSSFQPFWQ